MEDIQYQNQFVQNCFVGNNYDIIIIKLRFSFMHKIIIHQTKIIGLKIKLSYSWKLH